MRVIGEDYNRVEGTCSCDSQICDLQEKLDNLWAKTYYDIATVNSIAPDGNKNLKIVSDSVNLTVTDDAVNNAIRLDLDAALSSPPVTSVNGMTGTVNVYGDDIVGLYSTYDGTNTTAPASIQSDTAINAIATGAKAGDDALRTRMTAAENAISAEQTARINGDNALNLSKANLSDVVLLQPSGAQTIDEDLTLNDDLTVNGTGDIPVPTGTTGTYDLKATNSTRIKNELDNYSPMIRTTGNQDGLGIKRFPEMCRLPSILTAGTAGNYNSLYAVSVDNNGIYGVFEIYDRTNNGYGVYAGLFRSYGISFTKLYGTLPADGMAIALNAARDTIYVFAKSARITADVRFCVHAWETLHVSTSVVVDNSKSETDADLVAGTDYYAVIKV